MFLYTFWISHDLIKRETSINNLFREAKIHFGLLVLGFKRKWWWWTYIIWVRKITISSLIANILVRQDPYTIRQRAFIMVIVIGVSL